jgi:hypothetical protein
MGHTHDDFDYQVKGTRVVCNPPGYARSGVNDNSLVDPNLTWKIPARGLPVFIATALDSLDSAQSAMVVNLPRAVLVGHS